MRAHDTPPRMHRPITCEVIDRRLGIAETSGAPEKCAVCEEAKMSEFDDLVERYIAMWNEVDPDRRQRLIAETFSEGASYVDPLMVGAGHGGRPGGREGHRLRYGRQRAHDDGDRLY